MCTVFPTVTSCTIPNVGASGVAQVRDKRIVVQLQQICYYPSVVAVPQRAVRPHPEHHQREDLPRAVVVVRAPRPPHCPLHRLQVGARHILGLGDHSLISE